MDTPFWKSFRDQMPVARKWAYFDHASVSPLSQRVHVALAKWLMEATQEGNTVWSDWKRRVEHARDVGARLLGADRGEIALVNNTTWGISAVAEGFPWKSGENVVLLDNEFPSNQYPWLNLRSRGVEIRRIPTDQGRLSLSRLREACDSGTRIVALSWVGFSSGYRVDPGEVAELVHRQGALFLMDAIQGLGAFPLDVHATGIDFLAADGHKWLLGPEGAGYLYIRREHLDLLRPIGVGWNSVRHAHDFAHIELDMRDSAERYEGGSQNMAGFIGLAASVEHLLEIGPARIAERILFISEEACRRLREIGANIVSCRDEQHASGIVSFDLPRQDPVALRQNALNRGVALSARNGHLRISPHFYNDDSDIDRLIEVLREAA